MLSGASAPHTPTLKVSVIVLIVAILAYHFLIVNKK